MKLQRIRIAITSPAKHLFRGEGVARAPDDESRQVKLRQFACGPRIGHVHHTVHAFRPCIRELESGVMTAAAAAAQATTGARIWQTERVLIEFAVVHRSKNPIEGLGRRKGTGSNRRYRRPSRRG